MKTRRGRTDAPSLGLPVGKLTFHSLTPGTAMTEQPLRVLVVDDIPDTRTSFAILLRMWGHQSREASDGAEALRTAAGFHPHVVLLDLGLPDMDGCEVARKLRADPETSDALVVAVTGHGETEKLAQALNAGCDRYLLKPAE